MATRTVAVVDADLQALKKTVAELAALVAKLQPTPAPTPNAGSLSFNAPANSGLVGAI